VICIFNLGDFSRKIEGEQGVRASAVDTPAVLRLGSNHKEIQRAVRIMKLKNQVAVITGAGRNIGKAMAKLFATEGAKIAVVEMHQGRGQAVVDEITGAGGEAIVVMCDVSKSKDVQAMVKTVVAKFGGIDILVNNAALTDHANIFDSTEDEFDKVIAVSLKGPYLVTKYVAEQMRKQGRGGKIVNFGSTSGMVGRFDGIAYAAAKAGVINMTRAMAVQLAADKIRVNCVVPNRSGSPVGYDDDVAGSRTFQNLAGRLGTADDQAKAALFLVSDDSEFIIGHALLVDGGVMATANFPREQFQK
jgi:NAD(P)-dependent dehydrogenase (short-subunit alcohol dehydrogenase family)